MAPIVPILTAVAGVAGAVSTISASRQAKKDAAKQAALIKKQEEKIALEKEKQDKAAQERRQRLASRELLTGGETGLAGETQATLLGSS